MKKTFFILAIIIIIGIVYNYSDKPKTVDEQKTQLIVKRGDLNIQINAYGTLHAKNSLKVKSGLPLYVKITHLIDEGTNVKKGDELARFEETKFVDKIVELEDKILLNTNSVNTANSNYEISLSEGQDKIEKAQLELTKAKMLLEKYIFGDQPLKERELKVVLDQTLLDFKRKNERLKQLPKLLEEGFITQIEFETEELDLKAAKVKNESSELKLNLYKKYTKVQELSDFKSKLKNATNSLKRVILQVATKNTQLKAELKQAKRILSKATEQLNENTEYLKNCILKSPAAGIVIYGDPTRRHVQIKVNESVGANSTVLTLPDLVKIIVKVNIHESNIEQVQIGQNCVVTVDSANNQSFKGKISKIASIANTGNWRKGEDVKEFTVTVELEDSSPKVRPGSSARVVIHIDKLKDIIMAPTYAITKTKNETYCTLLKDGKETKQVITTGKNNISYTEIKSGLKESDILILK